ncbi:MAG: LysR family transcriptional regulator [Bacillota bacterium]
MIDARIHTFLTLCKVGNYRKTAEILSMTQPAVTQHVHFLEEQYGCKLFEYKDRKLFKTQQCEMLEKHALATVYNDNAFKNLAKKPSKRKIAIGATKTVGEYLAKDMVVSMLKRDDIQFEFIVDNTKHLMNLLCSLKLDVLMIEGYFDKNEYGYKLIKKQEIVGICGKNHPFANKKVAIEDVLQEHIIMREEGSGTRSVFETFLKQKNLTNESFKKQSIISSFSLIEKAVEESVGISFVYENIGLQNEKLSTFKIKGESIMHEFNYVYLKGANIGDITGEISLFEKET